MRTVGQIKALILLGVHITPRNYMTLYQFNQLPYEVQLATVHEMGTYLAMRWEGLHDSVLLYHLPDGLFAELC